MRRYEMVLVADPTIPEEKHDALITGFESMITEGNGVVHIVDRWGRRKLAYPIKRHHEGNYTVLMFDCEPEVEREIIRRMKLSDSWLRFLSVRADHAKPPTEEEKQALAHTRKEHLRRAAEKAAQDAAIAAGIVPAAGEAKGAADTQTESSETPAETPTEAPVEVESAGDAEPSVEPEVEPVSKPAEDAVDEPKEEE